MTIYNMLRGPWPFYTGGMALLAEETTTCTDADTYYKINGGPTWGYNPAATMGFEVESTGRITFIGRSDTRLLFSGSSDLSADKNCTITYAAFVNGALVPQAQTPHDFDAAHRTDNISITSPISLDFEDYIEVFCKSSVANTTVTHKTLTISLAGGD